MVQFPYCRNGHLKELAANGRLICRLCVNTKERELRRKARERHAIPATGKRNLSPIVPGSICPKGHQRVRECNGRIVCKPCQHHRLRAQAAYRRARPCAHVENSRGKLVFSRDDQIVCLDCVVEQANQPGL